MSWVWRSVTGCLAAAVLLTIGLPAVARAEEPQQGPPATAPTEAPPAATPATAPTAGKTDAFVSGSAAPPEGFVSSRNIEDRIRESRQQREAFFDLGIRDAMHRIGDRVYDAVGVRFTLSYTVLYQHASGGSGPRDAAGDDIDLIGTWDPFRKNPRIHASLEAAFEGRNRYADITPSTLSTTIDSLWTTTSGFNRQDFSLIQIYWRQTLLDGRLHLRIGKLSPYATFFGNRINSSALFFVNFAFADNPAVFMPGNGLGIHASWSFDEHWTLAAGIQNPNAVKTEIDPSTLRFGEFWSAVQMQYTADLPGLGRGTYRIGGWYTTPRELADTPAGGGTVISFDQELGEKAIGFVRWEWQGGSLLNPEVELKALTGTKQVIRGGLVFPGPVPAWADDMIGVAAAWGNPADSLVRDSVVGEIFYRGQLESSTQLTFSAQMIKSSTIYERVFVLSVRFRLEL